PMPPGRHIARRLASSTRALERGVLASCVVLWACATPGRLSFTEPDVTLQEIDVTGIGLTGGTFDLVFDVWNPNDYRLRSTRLEVGVDLEATHFADALLDRPLDLSPSHPSRASVPVPFARTGLGP